MSDSANPWTIAHQASLSFTVSWSLLKLTSIESVMASNHLSSVVPFSSHLQSFSASGSFPVSQFFASGGQSIGASASVLPMNIQDWFPLGWTGRISFQPKWLSRVFSNTLHTYIHTQYMHVYIFYTYVQKHTTKNNQLKKNGGLQFLIVINIKFTILTILKCTIQRH